MSSYDYSTLYVLIVDDFNNNCDPDLSWYYDNDLIGSVIHNVLVNGSRYAKKTIVISGIVSDNGLTITIEDDGEGFPQAMIDAASLESAAHSSGNSTQLGLFFAAKIAQLHQQKVYVVISACRIVGHSVVVLLVFICPKR